MANERRLIDADELRDYIVECSQEGQYRVYAGYAVGFIDNAPSVDAIIPVRCKDCKHMEITPDGLRWCNVWNGINGMGDDGYCNYGERRCEDEA